MKKVLTELEYLRSVQFGIVASEKLGGNLVKEAAAKGASTGLLMAQNVIRNALEESLKPSNNTESPKCLCDNCPVDDCEIRGNSL